MIKDISAYIDHTLLKPTASETDIRKLCEEAWIHQFKAVCIAPTYVAYTKDMLEFCPSKIEIATVIGFPFGYSTTETKLLEAKTALRDGATELDVVMNLSQFKSMAYLSVKDELRRLVNLAHENAAVVKIIVETAYLDVFELYTACEICTEAGTDFIKTSTGYASEGATPQIVEKMRTIIPELLRIEASGAIINHHQARSLIEAGADRIGTSQGVLIVSEA
jgi:deoxyribose-phosphate aldolase